MCDAFVGLAAENYAGAMSSEEKTAPVRLEIHLFHDGRVALELMSDWYTNLDLQVLHVDDAAAISSLIQRWSAGEYGQPQRQYIRQEAVPGITEAYEVEIGAKPTSELQRFTNLPEKLCDEFERALIASSSERRAYAAEFASNLSSKMREFLALSQRKAEARIADGTYLKVLEMYLADMRSRAQPEDQDYYLTVESGIGLIMHDERYLQLSSDSRTRELYEQIRAEQNALYQWWMNLSKGDKSGPR